MMFTNIGRNKNELILDSIHWLIMALLNIILTFAVKQIAYASPTVSAYAAPAYAAPAYAAQAYAAQAYAAPAYAAQAYAAPAYASTYGSHIVSSQFVMTISEEIDTNFVNFVWMCQQYIQLNHFEI